MRDLRCSPQSCPVRVRFPAAAHSLPKRRRCPESDGAGSRDGSSPLRRPPPGVLPRHGRPSGGRGDRRPPRGLPELLRAAGEPRRRGRLRGVAAPGRRRHGVGRARRSGGSLARTGRRRPPAVARLLSAGARARPGRHGDRLPRPRRAARSPVRPEDDAARDRRPPPREPRPGAGRPGPSPSSRRPGSRSSPGPSPSSGPASAAG
jgi:hypothetical protein